MINVSRVFVRCHAWRCEDSSVRFIMRISQVIVTVFEESSFIKRAIHLPAVKNKTGTVIYCRLPETRSFSSLYENQGVCSNNPEESLAQTLCENSLIFQLWSRRESETASHYIIVMYFTCDMWYWVFFSVTKEHKKWLWLPGGVESNSTCESRWRSWRGIPAIPAVRYALVILSVSSGKSLLLNAREALELLQELESFLSDWHREAVLMADAKR